MDACYTRTLSSLLHYPDGAIEEEMVVIDYHPLGCEHNPVVIEEEEEVVIVAEYLPAGSYGEPIEIADEVEEEEDGEDDNIVDLGIVDVMVEDIEPGELFIIHDYESSDEE